MVHNDFALPADLAQNASRDWARQAVTVFRDQFDAASNEATMDAVWAARLVTISEAFCEDLPQVLVWFSGKEVLAALGPWLQARGDAGAGAFRTKLRDFVIGNPGVALEVLPEWRGLLELLRQ